MTFSLQREILLCVLNIHIQNGRGFSVIPSVKPCDGLWTTEPFRQPFVAWRQVGGLSKLLIVRFAHSNNFKVSIKFRLTYLSCISTTKKLLLADGIAF